MKRLFLVTGAVLLALALTASLAGAEVVTLRIMLNAVKGGKNTQDVQWLETVLPGFEQEMRAQGTDVKVEFVPTGIKDEDYKARLALDIKGGTGPDIVGFDHFWVPEFAESGYLLPLDKYVAAWPDWAQFHESMKKMGAYRGKQYLVMGGTDVRMLYYNKELFKKAGLPLPWEPKSWDELLETARVLKKKLPGVIPLQINAGVEMGEATSMQGFYMVLLGTGDFIFDWAAMKWVSRSPGLLETLKFYKTVYVDEKLGDANLQVSPKAREKSFELYQQEKIAVYAEGTWMWTSVIAPSGAWGIPDRNQRIGWAAFPGSGKPGAPPIACVSGGTGLVVNPNSKRPDLAWKLIAYLNSKESRLKYFEVKPGIPARKDLADTPEVQADPFIAETAKKLVPYTTFRPGMPKYPEVSYLVQLASERVVTGQMTPEQAMEAYAKELEALAGKENTIVHK